MFIGIGTLANVATVLVGTLIGTLAGHRFSDRAKEIVTDALGLVTLLIAGTAAMAVLDLELIAAVGEAAPMLIVLGSIVMGALLGTWLNIEDRLTAFGELLRSWVLRSNPSSDTHTFVEGFIVSSLVFCIGPLTILGALSEGLGEGAQLLLLKAALDGFAAIAFAAAFGWGVAASAITIIVIQGGFTLVGVAAGGLLPQPHLLALSATGGLLLVAVALRLLNLKQIRVADMLPALAVAPALVFAVQYFQGLSLFG